MGYAIYSMSSPDQSLLLFLGGWAAGEIALVAVLLALARGSAIMRWSGAAFIAVVGLLTVLVQFPYEGELWDLERPRLEEFVMLGMMVFVVGLADMLLLGVARYFRPVTWQPKVIGISDERSRSQFSLRDILLATALVATALGLCNALVEHSEFSDYSLPQWPQIAIGMLIYVVVHTGLALPCVWLSSLTWRRRVLYSFLWLIWSAVFCGGFMLLALIFGRIVGSIPTLYLWEFFTTFMLIALGHYACIVGTLALLRWTGFEVVRATGDAPVGIVQPASDEP